MFIVLVYTLFRGLNVSLLLGMGDLFVFGVLKFGLFVVLISGLIACYGFWFP